MILFENVPFFFNSEEEFYSKKQQIEQAVEVFNKEHDAALFISDVYYSKSEGSYTFDLWHYLAGENKAIINSFEDVIAARRKILVQLNFYASTFVGYDFKEEEVFYCQDEAVSQLFEDGFLNKSNLHESIKEFFESLELIPFKIQVI